MITGCTAVCVGSSHNSYFQLKFTNKHKKFSTRVGTAVDQKNGIKTSYSVFVKKILVAESAQPYFVVTIPRH